MRRGGFCRRGAAVVFVALAGTTVSEPDVISIASTAFDSVFEAPTRRHRLLQHRESTARGARDADDVSPTPAALKEESALERSSSSWPLKTEEKGSERVEDHDDGVEPTEEGRLRRLSWPTLLLKGQSTSSESSWILDDEDAAVDLADGNVDPDADGASNRLLAQTKKKQKMQQQTKANTASSEYDADDMERQSRSRGRQRSTPTMKDEKKQSSNANSLTTFTMKNNKKQSNSNANRLTALAMKNDKKRSSPIVKKGNVDGGLQQRKKASSNNSRNGGGGRGQQQKKQMSSNNGTVHKRGANHKSGNGVNNGRTDKKQPSNGGGRKKAAVQGQGGGKKNNIGNGKKNKGQQKNSTGNAKKKGGGHGSGGQKKYGKNMTKNGGGGGDQQKKGWNTMKNGGGGNQKEKGGYVKKNGDGGNQKKKGGYAKKNGGGGQKKKGGGNKKAGGNGGIAKKKGNKKTTGSNGGGKKTDSIPSGKPGKKASGGGGGWGGAPKMCPCPQRPGWHGVGRRKAGRGVIMSPYHAETGGGGASDQGSQANMTTNNGGWHPSHSLGWGGGGRDGKSSKARGAWGGGGGDSWVPPPQMCECPTHRPTYYPTYEPTYEPTLNPTYEPTYEPSYPPTYPPTDHPTYMPTNPPTDHPTEIPTDHPTDHPTYHPTYHPTAGPTDLPTNHPTVEPTPNPSESPTPAPITPSPTIDVEECNWFYWGGEEGRGAVVGLNQEVPEFQPDEVIDLSAGSRHTFIIDEYGKAYVAGFIESFHAYQGHMGVDRDLLEEGPNNFVEVPAVIVEEGPDGEGEEAPAPKFIKVFAGAGAPGDSRDMHSLLIDAVGNVYTAGNNDKGQLCHGDLESRDIFQKVILPDKSGRAVTAAVGLDFTLILLGDGRVFGCGSNENGELGLGPNLAFVEEPTQIKGLSNVKDVSAGLNFGLYLERGPGRVFGSGSNLFRQLCKSTDGETVDYPMELGVKEISQIMAGRESSYFLHPNGSVESCGRNDEGQLADETFNDSNGPVQVDIPKRNKIRFVGSGPSSQSVFFVAGEDLVLAAGQNYRFQLGIGEIGDPVSEVFPVVVPFDDAPHLHEIVKVSSSGTHTVAISCRIFTENPTSSPTVIPTENPTEVPTETPTESPTNAPTEIPTSYPTINPTVNPSMNPTATPTISPSDPPTVEPTHFPTVSPTTNPTETPTETPTISPSDPPTIEPTRFPTVSPTIIPTITPTETPTITPTETPTISPSDPPTVEPTTFPSVSPTLSPTYIPPPTLNPTSIPTVTPTEFPTLSPTLEPTSNPTVSPTYITPQPTLSPTLLPSTRFPTLSPTLVVANWFFWGAEEGRGNKLGEDKKEPDWIEGDIQDVSAGSRHTFLIENIEKEGVAWAAGFIESDFGYRGHLGLGPIQNCNHKAPDKLCEYENDPRIIEKVFDAKGKKVDAPPFVRVYAGVGVPADSGEKHSILIGKNGKIYITGNNNKGQLCLGDDKREYVNYFHEVPGINKAVQAAVGIEFTLILTANGDVYGCGTNEVGQIGQGRNVKYSNKPVKIDQLSDIDDLSTGLSFAIFLDRDKSRVWGSGSNLYWQQCGDTGGEPFHIVREIIIKKGGNIKEINTNRESSYFLFEDGKVRACGRNDEGQLGNGDFVNSENQKTPIVEVNLKKKVVRLGSGPSSQSIFFILEDEVWGAGLNDRHQLGINEIGSREMPVKVDFQCEVEIEFVSSSGSHTVANGSYLDDCWP